MLLDRLPPAKFADLILTPPYPPEYLQQLIAEKQELKVLPPLLAQAKAHETARDHALRQDPWFDYAEGMLQIAIVLLSVSIIASMPALFFGGTALGLLGLMATLNGFFLLI